MAGVLPDFSSYFGSTPDLQGSQAAPQYAPTGTGNWFTSALGSGFHQALSEAGSAGEAVGRAIGADHFADSARAFSDAQRQSAAGYAREDLENAPWYNPEAIAYRVTQGLPTLAGAFAGAGAAALAAPEVGAAGLLGGAAAMLPSTIGANVQRREAYAGDLDQANALKAIGLGLPEAAIQGILPGHLEGKILTPAVDAAGQAIASTGLKGFLSRGMVGSAARAAGIQAPAAAATEWLTQQMGDPNRTFAQNASDIVNAALTGGVTGGVAGALLHPLMPAQHAIAKTPAQNVSDPALEAAATVPGPPPPTQPVASPKDIMAARVQAIADRPATLQQGPAPQPDQAILMPPPADEQARLQQARLDADRAARPVTRTPGTLQDRIAALGGAVEGPGQPPAPAPAPAPFGQRVGGAVLPLEGPPKPAGLLPPPTPQEPTWDWPTQRKELQQAKGWSKIVKGPFNSRDELVSTVADNVISRTISGDDIPKSLANAAKVLGVTDDKGELAPQFAEAASQKAAAAAKPPGVTAEDEGAPPIAGPAAAAPFTPPDRLEKAAVDLKHQGRWDALEAVRNRLLGDNLTDPDVQSLLSQTSDLQNRLLNPGRQYQTIDRATKTLAAQVDARDAEAKAPPTGPVVEKTALAEGPQPSPAAVAYTDRVAPTSDQTAPPTKEAKAKAAKRKPAQEPTPAPVVDETPTGAINAPETLKAAQAQEAVQTGEAEPGVTKEDVAVQKPNTAFAQAFIRQSAKDGGKVDIGVTAKRTREQMAKDAKAAKAPKTTAAVPEPGQTSAPRPLTDEEKEAFMALPPRERAIERDARYWEHLRTVQPDDVEARAQALDDATARLSAPAPKTPEEAAHLNKVAKEAIATNEARRAVAPLTKEARAKQARDAVRINREQVAKAVPLDEQHTPEKVEPRLMKSIEDVKEAEPPRVLDPNNPADARTIKRQQANAAQPPAVDPSLVSGFARDARRTQADVRRQSMNDTLRARLGMIESGRRPVTPVPPKVLRQIDTAKQALDGLQQSGAIIPRHEDFAGKDQRFQELLAQHREQLDLVDRAARLGGMEGLREVPRDFFGTDLYDEMSGHVTRQTEQNLERHAVAESQLQDAAAVARGERPLIRYSVPPTQQDVDIAHVVNTTNQMKDALGYIRDNGTSIYEKEMAHRLLQGGAGGTISFSDRPPTTTRELREGEYVSGYHYTDRNHTDLYDGGGLEHSILHEAAHAATERAIRGDTPAAKEITGLFDRVKALLPDVYGRENVSEFVAESFSNPQFQQTLKSMKVSTGSRLGDMWQSFKNAVFKALGMPDRMRTLFDQIMDRSNRLMGENVREASGNVVNQVRAGGQQYSEDATQLGNALIKRFVKALSGEASEKRRGVYDTALGWMTGDHLVYELKQHIPEAVNFGALQNHRGVRTDALSKPMNRALHAVDHLEPKAKDAWARLAARTIQRIDGFKTWAEHTWLHGDAQEAVLKQEHMAAVRDADILRRSHGGEAAWRMSIDGQETMRLLREIHMVDDLKRREYDAEQWHGFGTDPIRDFEANTALHDNPAGARAYLRQVKAEQMVGIKNKLFDMDTQLASMKKAEADDRLLPAPQRMTLEKAQKLRADIITAEKNREVLDGLRSDMENADVKAEQGPYFHLGREGDHFVSAHVVTDNNIPSDYALSQIQMEMDKAGFKDAVLARGVGNSSIYVRLRSEQERAELASLFRKLQSQRDGPIDAAKAVADGYGTETSIYHSIGPQWMRQALEAIENTPPDYPLNTTPAQRAELDAAHQQNIREQKRALMEMLPDTSLTKLYQERQNVQGFNANMFASMKAASVANARGLSNMSLARELGQSSVEMNKQLEAVNKSSTLKPGQKTATAQALGEITLRNKLYQAHVPSTFMDGVRRLVHTVEIGASPAYFFTLMSQIPTLSWTELAKTHGYVNAAAAMAKTTGLAFKVMKAVAFSEDALHFGMRRDALTNAGLNPDDVDFLMNLAARGAFNHGAYTESMAGHSNPGVVGRLQDRANVLGRYSEQFPRVLTALAARELHNQAPAKAGGMSKEDFAFRKVMESQFNWNPELNARQTTRSGNFGAFSPLINQFMGYQIRMTEKLYREFADGFGGQRTNETAAQAAERKRQSRVWLAGHAATVAMIAGTLGLPMVSVAASVFDKLADEFTGRDDYDVTASYRTFLAKAFGKEFGEAIARGAPRLAGLDFDHLGEGSIVPGSKMLLFATEKRKMEDAEKDWLKNMAGSSMGFVFNTAAGARDILNGDVMDGMIKFLPEILKGPTEALRLGERGFVDKNGNKLPITANAQDVMMTALGIDPAKEAEYDETKKVATGLSQMRQIRSQNITRHLMLAVNRGDAASFQSWEREAMQFQLDHPGMQSPLMDFSRAMSMHARNAAVAQGMGTPIGVQPRDIVGRGMTAFGNFRNGEQ